MYTKTPKTSKEQKENTNLKRYIALIFLAALLTIAKIWKQLKVSINKVNRKRCIYIHPHTYTHNGILLSHKKK